MSGFSQRLAKARKDKGMTQSEVAEKLNVSFQAVSLWERGETTPEIEKLSEIAALYDITLDWLLVGKDENELIMAFEEPPSDRLFNEERMYTYVKTYVWKGLALIYVTAHLILTRGAPYNVKMCILRMTTKVPGSIT